MAQIGSLNVKIKGDARGLKTAFGQARKGAEGFRGALATFKGSLAAGVVLGALRKIAGVAREAAAAIKETFAELDKLAKTSDKLGIAPEALAGLRHGAQISGIEIKSLDNSIERMVRRLSEAGIGKGEAVSALKEISLDAKKMAALSPEKQLEEIAEAMTKVESQSDRVRLAYQLFGREGVSMVNLLKDGSAGIRAFVEEAKRLGIAFSREELARIEQANDAIARFDARIKGLKGQLAVELAPIVESLTVSFENLGGRIAALAGTSFTLKTMFEGIAGEISFALNALDMFVRKIEVVVNRAKYVKALAKLDNAGQKRLDAELKKIMRRRLAGDEFLEGWADAIVAAKNAAKKIAGGVPPPPPVPPAKPMTTPAVSTPTATRVPDHFENPALQRGTAAAFDARYGATQGRQLAILTEQVIELKKANTTLRDMFQTIRKSVRDGLFGQFQIP